MITHAHGHIRSADADDVASFHQLYSIAQPRAALLDKTREPILPTRDELALMFAKQEHFKGGIFALEDAEGELRGFCALRGLVHDARYAELALLFMDSADYAHPLASEALAFVREEVFTRFGMYKLITQALNSEHAWVEFLHHHTFEQSGEQRQVLFAGGKWHNLLTFSLYHPAGDSVFGKHGG